MNYYSPNKKNQNSTIMNRINVIIIRNKIKIIKKSKLNISKLSRNNKL